MAAITPAALLARILILTGWLVLFEATANTLLLQRYGSGAIPLRG